MRDVVRSAFVPLTVSFEGGFIPWMFPDVKGLVSTGFGLLLEPVALALGLPWRRVDGGLATREEIVADFYAVKNHPDAARLGYRSVERIAKLRLDEEGLYQAFQGKLHANEQILRTAFPDWEEWPADAQLATLSMAWACGPAFQHGWPKLTAALRAHDWATASVECFMPEEATIGGLRPRNKANRVLYLNAARGADAWVLYWPRELGDDIPDTVPAPAETVPVLVPEFAIVHSLKLDGLPQEPDDEPPPEAA